MRPAFDEAWFASRATPGIRALKAYDPGHDVVAMRAQAGHWLVELGSNENPYGPSPQARAAVLDQLHLMHRYPDPRGASLRQALSQLHGVPVESILLGNGSHELLMQIGQVFADRDGEVVVPQYGFAVFALSAQAAGAQLRMAPAQPRDAAMPLGHDPTALQACVGPRTRLLFMANPNNPTGTWLDAHALGAFLDSLPPEVIVVVDEAYAEMTDAPDYASALTLLARHPNLVVTRTFSKAFGLAGLRCGYAIASPALVAVIERVRESFNVNAMALAAAEAALRDTAHLSWIVERNAAQREALSGALRARGVDVLPSQTNFLLAEFGAATARVEAGLLARDVVLRPMAGYGLPGFSRITIGTADENRKLLAALDEVLA